MRSSGSAFSETADMIQEARYRRFAQVMGAILIALGSVGIMPFI